jgi:hypothetical protein
MQIYRQDHTQKGMNLRCLINKIAGTYDEMQRDCVKAFGNDTVRQVRYIYGSAWSPCR